MALQQFTRNNDAVSIARPRFGYLACMLFFGLTIVNDVAAFSCHRSSPGRTLTSLSTMEQFTRSDTILFGSRDNDDNEDEKDEKQQWQPTNDLDIFGQPKDGSKNRGYEDEGEIRGPDRIKSCIPYILPLIDGDPFGNYIYERIPVLGDIHYVLLRPIVEGVSFDLFLFTNLLCAQLCSSSTPQKNLSSSRFPIGTVPHHTAFHGLRPRPSIRLPIQGGTIQRPAGRPR